MSMLTAEHVTESATDHTRRATGPRLVLSTVCLSGALEDKLRAAAVAGFHGVEILEYDLVISPWSPRRVRAECADLGLTIDCYQPFHVEALPPSAFRAELRRAERKFALLAELGASLLLVCSSRSPDGIDDDDLAAEQLHELADHADRNGVRLAYEAVPWGRIRGFDHARRIVGRADHPALGLCLDSVHLQCGDDPTGVEQIADAPVSYIQLADAPRPALDVPEWSLHRRMFPGHGSLDVAGLVATALEAGYTGPLALEVFNDVYQQADPEHAAVDGMRSMLSLIESVHAREPREARWHPAAGPLPRVPRLGGFGFVELAVDDMSGPMVAHTLVALGFACTGRHRSKRVHLWQQGEARVLLNYEPQRTMAPGTAAVCALAVDSSDPAESIRRAGRLLSPVLPRTRQPDEADLSAVAAPDGTAVFFCGGTGPETWQEDFAPTGAAPAGTGRLTAIDHVSFTETIDDFDEAATFYRAVLGLRPESSTELTAPFGPLRSWTAADPDHHVRITMSTAPLRHGDWSPTVPNPQHIAFATDDAVASAEAMLARKAPVLPVPGNYYDDLEARLDLPAELLTTMRRLSILYDRDEHGAYLHFFTGLLGSRVFFEIVQRVDGYSGYGAAGSIPLRMAAHRRQRLRLLTDDPPTARDNQRQSYSLAHLTALSLSPPELVDAAAAAGYRYVGLRLRRVTPTEPHYPLAFDPALMRATKTHLAAAGIEVLDIELARISPIEEPRDYLRFLEAGAELGARHVITQLPDPDFIRKVDNFARLCELARPLGLTIDLEFPSWTETSDLREATRVLWAAGQSNAGILVDLLHFARSGSNVAELRELPPRWFHFAHVCDAPAQKPTSIEGLIHTARYERSFPGEGGIDVQGILAALPAGIPYALEIPHAKLVAEVGAKEHARAALDVTRRHLGPVASSSSSD